MATYHLHVYNHTTEVGFDVRTPRWKTEARAIKAGENTLESRGLAEDETLYVIDDEHDRSVMTWDGPVTPGREVP